MHLMSDGLLHSGLSGDGQQLVPHHLPSRRSGMLPVKGQGPLCSARHGQENSGTSRIVVWSHRVQLPVTPGAS